MYFCCPLPIIFFIILCYNYQVIPASKSIPFWGQLFWFAFRGILLFKSILTNGNFFDDIKYLYVNSPYNKYQWYVAEQINYACHTFLKFFQGAWVAQSVGHVTSAQVMISQSLSSSPTLVSALTAQSLLQILSPSLSAPPLLTLCVSLKNKIKTLKKLKIKKKQNFSCRIEKFFWHMIDLSANVDSLTAHFVKR